jgi:ADP-ribose pyrophosphatase
MVPMNERTVSVKTLYSGRVLNLELHEVEVDDGKRTQREIIRHSGAIAAIATLPDGKMVLVRQYRKPVECEVLEIVAGCLDKGEAPEDCAEREIKEETGYDITSLSKLCTLWPSPGYTDETLHLFHAELAPSPGRPRPDDDERLEVVVMESDELGAMIERHEIMDGKTLLAWTMWKQKLGRS